MTRRANSVRVATQYLTAKLPQGWTTESVKKWMKTIAGDAKDPMSKCMKKMKGKVEDEAALCARFMDIAEGSTMWRGKNRGGKK